ncbi:MAG: Lactose transport system permease protein LacF, partial [Armatimonadota bacterium]
MKPRASGWIFAAPYLTLFTAFVVGPLVFGFAATLRFVWMAVPATILLALVIATGLNAVAGKRQGFWRAAIYVPHLLTVSVAGILWRWFYNKEFGILNALLRPIGIEVPWLSDPAWAMPAIVLMTLWWTLGGPSVVLLSGLQ